MRGPFSSCYPTQWSSVQEDDSSSLKSYKVCVFKERIACAADGLQVTTCLSIPRLLVTAAAKPIYVGKQQKERKIEKASKHPGNILECLTGLNTAAQALNAVTKPLWITAHLENTQYMVKGSIW